MKLVALVISLAIGVMVGVVAMVSYSVWACMDALDTD